MNLFKELKRRNVIRVAIAYLIIGWLLAQISTTLEDALNLPPWFDTLIVTVMLIGFPIAIIISWIYELTPEGIKKEKDIIRDDSITNITAKKLNYITIFAALSVVGIFVWQQMSPNNMDSRIRENDKVVVEQVPVIPAQAVIQSLDLQVNNKSIAVLPFTNMANNPESEPITVGLHDDLLTHLSKISALKVISRTSVLRYRDTQIPIAEIAKELGVASILEGGVQKSANQIRINVQLIDAQTDEHLWAEIYDRELTASNIFKIQTEISVKIAAALQTQLSPEELTSISKQDTENLEAYNAYLAGRQLLINRNSHDLKQALALFQRATELDPNYALAYVGQADSLNLLVAYSDLPENEMFTRGEPLIAKALKINPLLAEAHTSKGSYLTEKGDFDQAEKSFLYSLKSNPNYATTYHWYGLLLREELNRLEEALHLLRKAANLDPLSPVIQISVAASLQSLGLNKQALIELHKVKKFAPKFHGAPGEIADIYSLKGDFVKSIHWNKKSISLDTGNINLYTSLFISYLDIGDVNGAKATLDEIDNRFTEDILVENLQGYIYVSESNLKMWSQSTVKMYNDDPSDTDIQVEYAYSLMIDGYNQQALDLFQTVFLHSENGPFTVTINNLDDVIAFVFVLKQQGQIQKSNDLISQIQDILDTIPDHNIDWAPIYIKAIQGEPKQAAIDFAKLIEEGKYQFWWFNLNLPYFKEVKKQPEFIKANQRLMELLKQQRLQLAELELKGSIEERNK